MTALSTVPQQLLQHQFLHKRYPGIFQTQFIQIKILFQVPANHGLFFIYFRPFRIPTTITIIVSISTIQIEKVKRWCTWDSNQRRPHNGKRRPNHGAMPLLNKTIYYTYYIYVEPLNESLIENYVYSFLRNGPIAASFSFIFVYSTRHNSNTD